MATFRRPKLEECKASFRAGPTVEMKGLRDPGHRCPDCKTGDRLAAARAKFG